MNGNSLKAIDKRKAPPKKQNSEVITVSTPGFDFGIVGEKKQLLSLLKDQDKDSVTSKNKKSKLLVKHGFNRGYTGI